MDFKGFVLITIIIIIIIRIKSFAIHGFSDSAALFKQLILHASRSHAHKENMRTEIKIKLFPVQLFRLVLMKNSKQAELL